MKRLRKHLNYANVAASLALILAIGGGTTAIALRGKGTVRSDDIKNGNVTGVDLSQTRVVSKVFTSPDDAIDENWTGATGTAHCPHGFRLLTGGGAAGGSGNGRAAISFSRPSGNGWTVSVQQDSGMSLPATAYALCLKKRPGRPRLTG